MKSQCGVSTGRVTRPGRRDVENEEIQVYLSKLKDLVPFMPKNRKLSKLEVIQYVIDYICDLQEALEAPGLLRAASTAAVAAAAAGERQPLGVLAPNTLTSCSTLEAVVSSPMILDKPSPSDTRPVSV